MLPAHHLHWGALLSLVITPIAGALSDHSRSRFGRRWPYMLAGTVGNILFLGLIAGMTAGSYIIVGLWPSLPATFAIGAAFGIGYGAYQAVDWALAIDVLPDGDSAAKDMGIWHVALVLPQILAPAITGITLDLLKDISLRLGYTAVFVMTALWCVLGTVLVRKVRGAR